MSQTATYIVYNPQQGTTYYAPSGFFVIPNAGSNVTAYATTTDGAGNLHVASYLQANILDVSDNIVTDYFGGNNFYQVDVISSAYTNGARLFTCGALYNGSGVGQLRMYLVYTGHLPDVAPNAPFNLNPANGQIVNSQTPTFYAGFSPGQGGDTLSSYFYSIANGANGSGSVIYNSPQISANGSEIGAGQMQRPSDFTLTFGNSYSWICRMINQNGLGSPLSAWANFTVVQGPNAPGAVLPSGVQTTTTPGWSFQYTSPAATAEASYHWWITNASGQTVYDPGSIAHSASSGATITGTISGSANLQYGASYFFNVLTVDTNGATSPTTSQSFSIANLPQVTPLSPINNATVNAHTPTFTWSYTDPGGYAQSSYQVKVYNASSGALIHDSGGVSSSANSYTLSGASISYGTSIRWIVQVGDTASLVSGFSASSYAYVDDLPTCSITAPTDLSTISTSTPTVTWSYTASSGGSTQASAVVTLEDTSLNVLATYNVSGAGTSFMIPSGVLINGTTYKLLVTVIDTVASSGQSALVTFELLYTPPADVQGQPSANGKNYLLSALLDSGTGGVATNWSQSSIYSGATVAFSIDNNVTQPVPSGEQAPIFGAQSIAVTALPSGSSNVEHFVAQRVNVSTAGWTIGTTKLSVSAQLQINATAGIPYAYIKMEFFNSSNASIGSHSGSQDTQAQASSFVQLLGPQNITVPSGASYVIISLIFGSPTRTDLGTCFYCDAELDAATSSSATFIEGSLGTGFSYDTNGFSVRTYIAGNLPTVFANVGNSIDPIGANGATLTFTWDTSLADSRFLAYVIERRLQSQASDPTTWTQIATITSSAIGVYTDFTIGAQEIYQYAVRQQIVYTDGAHGISAHRAVAAAACNFSPAWYITNTDGAIYNMRFNYVDISRTLNWQETATYSQYLGRVGQARDAGPPLGMKFDFIAYFNDSWGDSRVIIRRQLIAMQRLNVVWYLRDPEGMVLPVYLQNIEFGEGDTDSDTMLTATLHLMQAADTLDY